MRRTLALLVVLAAAPCAHADQAPGMPLVPYEDEGPFVVQPAKFISAPVYGAGFLVGAFVCLPASIIQQGDGKEPVPHEKEASLVCGKYVGTAVGWPVYAAVGVPFYVLKKSFWDFPRAVGRWMSPKAPPPPPAPAPAPPAP